MMHDKADIALVMITVDRTPKENYLPQTLENMKRAGVFESDRLGYSALVFSTASMEHFLAAGSHGTMLFHKLDIPPVDAPRLACENAGRALQLGGEKAKEHNLSWVLFCEDDLDFCADFIGSVGRWLDEYGNDHSHTLFAFGAAYQQVTDLKGRRDWWQYPYRAFYGTQCFAIRPADAVSLGSYIASNPPIGGITNPSAYDLVFHQWMDEHYPDGAFLASVPSFVQHIGRQSICTGKEKTHTFDSWPGCDWSYNPLRFGDGSGSGVNQAVWSKTSERKPRVLWVGDSPTVATGFSLCTRKVCSHLHSAGWEVHVLGMNYFGDPHPYPYTIWPCVNPLDNSRDVYGCQRLPKLIYSLKPDVVVLLNDPWNVEAYLSQIERFEQVNQVSIRGGIKLVGWLAVDGRNTIATDFNHRATKPDGSHKYGRLDHIAVWTDFARDELIRGGWDGLIPDVISLGVDRDVFHPVDQKVARSRTLASTSIPHDSFIVGVVGRNQYRKRIDLCIAYFAEWIKSFAIDDAYLYLHCAPTADRGVDIPSLVRYHGISGHVILAASSSLGHGIPELDMSTVYSSFDVCMTMTQGEGFGLCTLEAMSCGVPTIGPDWSGLGSWASAMVKIPCTSTAMTAPIGANMYTIGGVADKEETIRVLNSLYENKGLRISFGQDGVELADQLTWQSTVAKFEMMLREVLGYESLKEEAAGG